MKNSKKTLYLLSSVVILSALVCFSPVFAEELTFFAVSDTHYGVDTTDGKEVVKVINALPGAEYPTSMGGTVGKPRGIIMSGDLINDGGLAAKYPAQWANYLADFGVNGEGRCKFPVFEGLGNHDVNEDLFVFNEIKKRNQVRKELNYISNVSDNGYHYSWDWDGIHFINLNIFPGNVWPGEADTYGAGHNPMYARDFLKEDLEKTVGNSGSPVVTIQHFRPIDDNWWTYGAADKFHKILQDYNVILIMVGHQGGGVNNTWRGINWASSNGELDVYRISDNKLCAVSRRGDAWGEPFQKTIYRSYKTSGLPAALNNGDWASNVTSNAATLSGKILYEAVSPTQVTVYWGTTDGGDKAESWANSKDLGVQTTGVVFSAEITGLLPWTDYYYRCRATNSEGSSWAGTSIPFSTKGVLPAGWDTVFIGYEQRPWGGAHNDNGDVFTVRGSGRDICEPGSKIDNFQYAYKNLNGDGEIKARIATMVVNSREPKVGVMLRETLDADSKSVSVLLSPGPGTRLMSRSDTGGKTSASENNTMKTAPYWVKLVRSANTFTGYMSSDGNEWTPVGSPVTIEMTAGAYAGLAVTAGNRDGSKNHTATFDNVSVVGKVGDAVPPGSMSPPGSSPVVK